MPENFEVVEKEEKTKSFVIIVNFDYICLPYSLPLSLSLSLYIDELYLGREKRDKNYDMYVVIEMQSSARRREEIITKLVEQLSILYGRTEKSFSFISKNR